MAAGSPGCWTVRLWETGGLERVVSSSDRAQKGLSAVDPLLRACLVGPGEHEDPLSGRAGWPASSFTEGCKPGV